MELNEYIKHRELSVKKAADELGITRQYLYMIIAGKKEPGRKLVNNISKWSQNFVKSSDLWKNVSN
jgi:plasmid maintenance system antidote protein VapI